MKISMISVGVKVTCAAHIYCSSLPPFIVVGNATFHLKVRENKGLNFLFKSLDPPISIYRQV